MPREVWLCPVTHSHSLLHLGGPVALVGAPVRGNASSGGFLVSKEQRCFPSLPSHRFWSWVHAKASHPARELGAGGRSREGGQRPGRGQSRHLCLVKNLRSCCRKQVPAAPAFREGARLRKVCSSDMSREHSPSGPRPGSTGRRPLTGARRWAAFQALEASVRLRNGKDVRAARWW